MGLKERNENFSDKSRRGASDGGRAGEETNRQNAATSPGSASGHADVDRVGDASPESGGASTSRAAQDRQSTTAGRAAGDALLWRFIWHQNVALELAIPGQLSRPNDVGAAHWLWSPFS